MEQLLQAPWLYGELRQELLLMNNSGVITNWMQTTATDHNCSWLLLGFVGTVQLDGDMPGHSLQKQVRTARLGRKGV